MLSIAAIVTMTTTTPTTTTLVVLAIVPEQLLPLSFVSQAYSSGLRQVRPLPRSKVLGILTA